MPPVTSQSNRAKDVPPRSFSDSPAYAPESSSQQISPSPLGSCHVREAVQRGLLDSTHPGPSGKVQQQPVASTKQMSPLAPTNYVFTNVRPSLATPSYASESSTPSHPAYNFQKREDRARKGGARRSAIEAREGEGGEWKDPGGLPKGRLSSDSATDVMGRNGSLPSASAGRRLSKSRSVEMPTNFEEVGRQRRSSISFVRDVDGYQFGTDKVACTPDFDDLSVAVVLDPSHLEMRTVGDVDVPVAELAREASDLYLQSSPTRQSSGSFRTTLISPSCLKSQWGDVSKGSDTRPRNASLSTHRATSFQMERRVSFQEEVEVLTFGPGTEEENGIFPGVDK